MAYKYDAFLSYSHEDRSLVKQTQNTLEFWMPRKDSEGNKRRRLKVFRDETHLSTGNLTDLVVNALYESNYLIVFCSENASRSEYVYKEIEHFLFKFPLETSDGRKKAMDHILFAGCENGSKKNKAVMRTLITKAIDGKVNDNEFQEIVTKAIGNLYADFGSTQGYIKGSQRRKQIYKLASTMLGLDLDDLWNRAERRRKRIIAGIISGTLIIAALLTTSILSYKSNRNMEARRLSLVAESQLKDGNRILATQLSLASMNKKLFYSVVAPEAVSVLTETTRVYGQPTKLTVEMDKSYDIGSSEYISMDTSSDGRYLAAKSDDGDIIVWDVESGHKIMRQIPVSQMIQPNLLFAGDDYLLIYSYTSCQCYDTTNWDLVWEKKYDISEGEIFSIGSAASVMMTDGNIIDGLTNIRAIHRKNTTHLISSERKDGVCVRDVKTGKVIKQLTRDEIEKIIPGDVTYYIDDDMYFLKLLSKMHEPREIGWDCDEGVVYIPCYRKSNYYDDKLDDFQLIPSLLYPGVISWNMNNGTTEYIELDYSFAENNNWVYGEQTILYPSNGIILKTLNSSDKLSISAFDSHSGEEIWNHIYSDYGSDKVNVSHCVVATDEGIAMIRNSSVYFIDPYSGKEIKQYSATLNSEERISTILCSETFNDSVNPSSLRFLTTEGRVCRIAGDTIEVNEDGQTLPEKELSAQNTGNTLNKSTSLIFIQSDKSYTGTSLLFNYYDSKIKQYKLESDNDKYVEIATVNGDTIGNPYYSDIESFPIGNDMYLFRTEDKAWHLYDISEGKSALAWENTENDIKRAAKDIYNGIDEDFSNLKYAGTDKEKGVFLYGADYAGAFIDLKTGNITPTLVESLLTEDVRQEIDLGEKCSEESDDTEYSISNFMVANYYVFYLSEKSTGDSVTLRLYCWDTKRDATRNYTIQSSKKHIGNLELIMDTSGHYAVILGLPEGPWFINIDDGSDCFVNSLTKDKDDLKGMDVFNEAGSHDVTCRFSTDGKLFVINYTAADIIRVFETSNGNVKLINEWNYSNITITDVIIEEDSMIVFTDERKIMRIGISDMKLKQSVSLSGNGQWLLFSGTTKDGFWIKDSKNTVYCIDKKSFSSQQIINNVAAVDTDSKRLLVYKKQDGNITLGCLPLVSNESIIKKARDIINGIEMSEEEKVYFGVS